MSQIDLGYLFFPPTTSGNPFTFNKLTVWLRPCPTRRHYDPEVVQCSVVSAEGGCDQLSVHHPWPAAGRYRICCGPIVLNDRKGKIVEALTFGGELRVDPDSIRTTCVFQSPAPILAISEEITLANSFAAEVQALLAEQRARCDMLRPHDDFDRRLAGLAPLPLYLACLVSLDARLRRTTAAGNEAGRQLMYLVERTQRELEAAGRWPGSPVSLDRLLQIKRLSRSPHISSGSP